MIFFKLKINNKMSRHSFQKNLKVKNYKEVNISGLVVRDTWMIQIIGLLIKKTN